MVEKRRFLDVWIVETNTVYKEVPFAIVSDWVQQGRLLPDDMIKPSGTREWMRLGGSPEMVPYLPKPEPHRPDDQAEAMEPVALDFSYKRPREAEDDDLDMIPLIDVSLVLLIFFMLTASTAVVAGFVNTPETQNGMMAENTGALRIDITLDDGAPVYALGVGDAPADADNSDLRTQAAVLDRLKAKLAARSEPAEVIINADKELKEGIVDDLLLELRREPIRSRISLTFFGVSETEP